MNYPIVPEAAGNAVDNPGDTHYGSKY